MDEAPIAGGVGRVISYVRISVTDRCPFRCLYCMPEEGIPLMEHHQVMGYEDMVFLCRVLWSLGVRRVRLTGGEPFARKGFLSFLAMLRDALPSLALAVTTNGALVEPWADAMARLNLDGVSVSLDSLDPTRFRAITRKGDLIQVLRGIRALRIRGLDVKINTVLIKGYNDDELVDLLDFARREDVLLRLIEFMPLDRSVWEHQGFISAGEMVDSLPDREFWVPEENFTEGIRGPATYLRNRRTGQRLGIIAAVSHHFCQGCNRLRVSCGGGLRSCLFDHREEDLLPAIRRRDRGELARQIREVALKKPLCWRDIQSGENRMSRIGG